MIPEYYYQDKKKIDSLPVTIGSSRSTRKYLVYMSLALGEIKRGDNLSLVSRGVVSNRVGYNVLVASAIYASESAKATSGEVLKKASGTNLNPERHHHLFQDVVMHKFERDYKTCFINVVYWSASTAAKKGDELKVDDDRGEIQALVWRM